MIWLLRLLGWGRTALSALVGFIGRYPWQAACIALLCLSGWLWHGKSEAIAGRAADRAAYVAAQEEAEMRALAAKAETERKYERIATDADLSHARALADARAATDRYIAARRVRPEAAACSASGSDPAPGNPHSELPAGMPSGVVMAEADVRACSDLYDYAVSAHEWAVRLGR